jgi:hypothetical protein
MKATLVWLGALLVTAAAGTTAQAGHLFCCHHPCCAPPPCHAFGCSVVCQAPNAWGAGCCMPFCNGAFCQPAPFPGQGPMGPSMAGSGGAGGFPVHPFARSPRDYFMYGDP